jgi:hypothetical protein
MLGKIALAAGLMTLGVLAAPQTPSAAPISTPTLLGSDTSVVQPVRWRGGRCRYWRHECAERWGWGTPRYYRCLWRHDCAPW